MASTQDRLDDNDQATSEVFRIRNPAFLPNPALRDPFSAHRKVMDEFKQRVALNATRDKELAARTDVNALLADYGKGFSITQ